MNTRSIIVVASLATTSLAFLSACSTTGRCIGVEGAMASTGDRKVLLNLNADGVAIDGYDPVAFFTDGRPVMGDLKFRSIHGAAIYWFVSPEHQAMFEASPEKYEPQFGGWCAYAASIDTLSPIEPKYWEIVDGRLLLQHNQKAWDLWHRDAAGNLVKADANWPGLVELNGAPPRTLLNLDVNGLALAGYDPTSYFIDSKPLKGDPTLARVYQGATYYFVDAVHKNAFEKEPARYVPQFGGFCGYAASISKVSPVNPEIWQIVDGRLVLQHTPEAYRLFNENVAASYAKAQENWPVLAHRRCGG